MDPEDARRYVAAARWEALAQVKEEAWLARWRKGPAAQIRAMDALRESVRQIRGAPTKAERDEDLADHIRLAERMRRADRR